MPIILIQYPESVCFVSRKEDLNPQASFVCFRDINTTAELQSSYSLNCGESLGLPYFVIFFSFLEKRIELNSVHN